MAKPALKIEKTKDKVKLVVTGNLTIQHSKELQRLLLQHCDFKKAVQLVLNNVAALDVAGIQLAYAWKSEVIKKGGLAEVTLPVEKTLLQLLEKASITKIF
jgi:anti-anti-sigma regulatory factor